MIRSAHQAHACRGLREGNGSYSFRFDMTLVDSNHPASSAMHDNPYSEILGELARARVQFVLGGGLACVLQGVERVTMDVDVAVLMEPANFAAFCACMARLNLRPRLPIPPQHLLDPEVVEAMVQEKNALVYTFVDADRPVRQVDVFLAPHLSYPALLPDTECIDLTDFSVRVLTKKKLLALKLGIHPSRAKDSIDIEFLRRHVD